MLYRLASAIELITGITLLVFPALVISLLFRPTATDSSEQLAQLYGLALIGLGAASWGSPCPTAAKRGLLVYNSTAAILLLRLTSEPLSGGLAVWAGAGIHLVFSVLMIRDQSSTISD